MAQKLKTKEAPPKVQILHPNRSPWGFRTARGLVLALLAIVVGLSVFYFREDINLYSFRKVFASFNITGTKVGKELPLSYDTSSNPAFATTEDDLLVLLSGSQLSLTELSGEQRLQEKLSYSTPALSLSGKYVAAYDRGGLELRLISGYNEIKKLSFDYPILTADVNRYGEMAVVTGARAYKNAVTIYNAKHEEVYRWNSAERYITDVDISSGGKNFAIASTTTVDGTISSRVSFFSIDKSDPLAYTDFPGELFFSVVYKKDGSVSALSDGGLYTFQSDGSLAQNFGFSGRVLQYFDTSPEKHTVLVLNSHAFGSNTSLVVLDQNAKTVCDITVGKEVKQVVANDRRAVLLTTDSLLVYDLYGNLLETVPLATDVRRLLLTKKGDILEVGINSTVTINIK